MDRLNDRRDVAESVANSRKTTAYSMRPRLKEIEKELGMIGASVGLSALRNGNIINKIEELAERSLALQEESKAILAEIGMTPESLEPDYKCKRCGDTGYVELDNKTVVCDCLIKLMSDISCESLNALSPLELSTFESFKLDHYSDRPDANGIVPLNRMSKIYNYCREYADSFTPSSKGVLMRGATGLGKTHLSLAIANEVIRKGYSVVYVSAPDILNRLEREHFSYKYDSEEDTFGSLIKCDLLILDDLGTEFISQFSVSAVYNIFNSRVLAGKPVIINTNLTIGELLNNYSQRFVSRVMGSCDKLDFIGEDIRPKLKG